MTLEQTLKILDNLADGLHPDTHESLPPQDACNSRSAIRALQFAIDFIKTHQVHSLPSEFQSTDDEQANHHSEMEEIDVYSFFSDDRMFDYLQEFKATNFNPTVARLGKCLVGTQAKSVYQHVKDFSFYGVLSHLTTYNKIKPIISDFFEKYHSKIEDEYTYIDRPWKSIDFFDQDTFNSLSGQYASKLKEAILNISLQKLASDFNTESVQMARKVYPRAYEPWEQQENDLLLKTLRYTNDLDVLSEIFQRGQGAIRSQGQKLLYQIAQSALSSR